MFWRGSRLQFERSWLDQQNGRNGSDLRFCLSKLFHPSRIMSPKSPGSWMAAVLASLGDTFSRHTEHFKSGIAWRIRSGQFSCLQNSWSLTAPGWPRFRCIFNNQACSSLLRSNILGPCFWLIKSTAWWLESAVGFTLFSVSNTSKRTLFASGVSSNGESRTGLEHRQKVH